MSWRHPSRAQSGIVEEFEYQVTVRRVNIQKIGSEVEAGPHHLPCQFKHGRCVAGNFETYIWNATQTCPLRQLSQGAATLTESHLVMPEHNIELTMAAAVELNITGCPPLQLRPTEVAHVYAAVGPMAAPAHHLLEAPAPAEVDPQLDTAVRLRAVNHQIRRLKQGQQPVVRRLVNWSVISRSSPSNRHNSGQYEVMHSSPSIAPPSPSS